MSYELVELKWFNGNKTIMNSILKNMYIVFKSNGFIKKRMD